MVALAGNTANPLSLRWETGYLNIIQDYILIETQRGNWVVRSKSIGKIEQTEIELGGTILKIVLKESRRTILIYGPVQIINNVQAILSSLLRTVREQPQKEADLRV